MITFRALWLAEIPDSIGVDTLVSYTFVFLLPRLSNSGITQKGLTLKTVLPTFGGSSNFVS